MTSETNRTETKEGVEIFKLKVNSQNIVSLFWGDILQFEHPRPVTG